MEIYPLDDAEKLFSYDQIELYKFYLKVRLPQEAMEAWFNTLSEEDKLKIEEFKKEISNIVLSVDSNPQQIFYEMGLQILKSVSEGTKT